MTFADQVRRARKNKGITQVQLAEMLGLSKGTVAMWETTTRVPVGDTLERLSKLLEVPIVFGDLSKADAQNMDEMILLTGFRWLDQPGREAILHTIVAEQKRLKKAMKNKNRD